MPGGMAFELRPDKSTRRALARIAGRQLGAAGDRLGARANPSEDAIHEARRRVKKARAVLALIEADRGRGVAKSDKGLRAVNRRLSPVRDASAMIETLRKLHAQHPELFSEHVYARLRRRMSARMQDVMREAGRSGGWKQAGRTLRKLEKAARRWRTAHKGFAALAPGIRKTHRRARKALARARDTNAAADFHEWRKAVKALWYEVRLVGGGSPAIARDIRALRSAETWLGDDHNFVVLCGELGADPSVCRTVPDVDRLRSAVDAIQRRLRRQAIARTRSIFAAKPRAYVRRVERAWDARQRDRSRRSRRRAA